MTRLIVTADDFGLCPETNRAICRLHDRGVVDRASLIVNTPWFEASVAALRARPALEVGIHLNLTDGAPVSRPEEVPSLVAGDGCFPGGRHYEVAARILTGRVTKEDVRREWRAQIVKARDAGMALGHLNAHGHLHLLPPLHGIVLELLREFGIPSLRLVRRGGFSSRGVALGVCSAGLARALRRSGLSVACPDRILGLDRQGAIDVDYLRSALPSVGDGTAELIVHPSEGDNAYHRHWGYAGDRELAALLDDTAARLIGRLAGKNNGSAARDCSGRSPVSVIVPTFREAENIAPLVDRLKAVAEAHRLELELLIVDDLSDDGTADVVRARGEGHWVRVIERSGARSLSWAVVEGLQQARHQTLVVMDADLSHPPEAIPLMLDALRDPAVDFVIGSRYVPGGTTDADWGLSRRLNGLGARLLARPLTSVRDPNSGFFAIRRERFLAADELNPVGYKIGLELLVKCGCRNVREIPIHFSDRRHGQTKLGLRQRLQYLEHLRRLCAYRLRGRRLAELAR